jgi:hypothetical protein
MLRFLFDNLQTDWMFNLMLSTRAMRRVASEIYFHQRNAASHGV